MTNLKIGVENLNSSQLAALEQRAQNPTPLLKAWANYLEGLTVEAFQQETAPFGAAWQPLRPATIERKLRRKSPPSKNRILRDRGTLYDTIAARIDGDAVIIGTNQRVGAYSLGAIHQFGAPRRNIPPRPFLPMDAEGEPLPQVRVELQQLAEDYFLAE